MHGASTAFNPTIPQRIIDAALKRDPERGKAEWLGEWRDLESSFLPSELILSAVDLGITVREPEGRTYMGFVDAAGGAGSDSFTCAICHMDSRRIFLDAIYEKQPPFSPQSTVAEIASLLRKYSITHVTGDRFAGAWPVEAFAQHGISYEQSKLSRSEIYVECIPLFTSGRVRLLDNQRLIDQFSGLRRKTQPGGREQIDHAPQAHDDLSNAAAGAMTLLGGDDRSWVVRRYLIGGSAPAAEPTSAPDPIPAPKEPPPPIVVGPGEILIDCPQHLNVPWQGQLYRLRAGKQTIPATLAEHPVVRRLIAPPECRRISLVDDKGAA